MIHFQHQDKQSYCGEFGRNDIMSPETPRNNKIKNICQNCVYEYNLEIQRQRIIYNNRPNREKFKEWLSELAYLGESDFDVILFPTLIIVSCGTIIPAKYFAKFLLRLGV